MVDPEDAARFVTEYFATTEPNSARSFDDNPSTEAEYSVTHPTLSNFHFELLQVNDLALEAEIKGISVYKSSGIDGISSRVLKDLIRIMIRE